MPQALQALPGGWAAGQNFAQRQMPNGVPTWGGAQNWTQNQMGQSHPLLRAQTRG
jgi:hypothetical protein